MNLKPPRLNIVLWDDGSALTVKIKAYLQGTGLPFSQVKTTEALSHLKHIALVTSVYVLYLDLAGIDIWHIINIQPNHSESVPFEDPFSTDTDPFALSPFDSDPFPAVDVDEAVPFDFTICPPPGTPLPPLMPTITNQFKADSSDFPEDLLYQRSLNFHLHCLCQGLPLEPLLQHQYSEQPAEATLHCLSLVKPTEPLERERYSCETCPDFATLTTKINDTDIVILGFGSENSGWIKPNGKLGSNGYAEALQSAASPIRALLLCPDTVRMQSFLKRLGSLNISVIAIRDPYHVPKINVTLQPSLILADLGPTKDQWSPFFSSIEPDPRNFVDISGWLDLSPEQFCLNTLLEISKTEQQIDAMEYRKGSTNARRDRVECQVLQTFLRTQSTEERATTRTHWKAFCQVLKVQRATHFQRDWNCDWQLEISGNIYKYNRTQQTFSCHGPNQNWELANIVNSATYTNQGAIAIHLFHSPLYLLPAEHYRITKVDAFANLELVS